MPSWRRIETLAGAALLTGVALMAVLGQIHTPYDPDMPSFGARLQPPSFGHWLGTDVYGRDQWSRILAGAGVTVWVSLLSVCMALVVGGAFGTLAGYLGGAFDRVATLFADALLTLPGILLALTIMTIFGPSLHGLVVALGIAYTPRVARVARSAALSIREKEFVEASRALGNTALYTIVRHVVPNGLAPLIVLGSALFGSAVLTESALSFLGLGVPPPSASWGGMLSEARPAMRLAPWLSVFPGLCISMAVLGVNLLGDSLRDALDPRMRLE